MLLIDPPTPVEQGILFENWFVREVVRYRDYLEKSHDFAFWREGTHEIDLLITGGRGPVLAFECKSGRSLPSEETINAFRRRFPKTPLIVASLKDTVRRRLESGIEVLPWRDAIALYRSL